MPNNWITDTAEATGTGAISGLVGAGMGLLLEGHQDRRQLKQQGKLQELEMSGQRQMTDYNMAKQLQMWKDTNYSAQMEELKKAGLNPGLLYGMGGAGGATTGQATGNVTGGKAAEQSQIQQSMEMGMNMQLLKAQKENIEADTANKKADLPVKGSTAENIATDTGKKREEIKGIQLNNEFLRETMYDRVDIINTDAARQIEELDIAIGNKEVERSTRIKRIEEIRLGAAQKQLQNALIEANTKATGQSIEESKKKIDQMDAQIKTWAAQISQGLTGLDIQDRRLTLDKWIAEVRASFPSLGQSLGRLLNGAMEEVSNLGTGKDLPKYEAPKEVNKKNK